MAGAQAGNDEPLLGFRGRGLLDHFIDLEQTLASGDEPSADRTVEGQLALVRRLHGGDAAILRSGGFDELLGAPLLRAAEVEMIADEEQERILAHELPAAMHRVTVAERRGLFDELDALGVRAGGRGVGGLIAGADDGANLLHARLEDFLDDDLERGLGDAVAVHEALQRQGALSLAGGGDDSFLDVHGGTFLKSRRRSQIDDASSIRGVSGSGSQVSFGLNTNLHLARNLLLAEVKTERLR